MRALSARGLEEMCCTTQVQDLSLRMNLLLLVDLVCCVFDGSELVSTFSSDPTCLAMSLDGQLMVVGTGQGMLHIINKESGQV